METKIKEIIEEYQCTGCLKGSGISCFASNPQGGIGCGSHKAGTYMSSVGAFFLGMPKGFNRTNNQDGLKPIIFQNFADGWGYTKYNVPVWKYLSEDGHTFVRGISPRINSPFVHVFLENCIAQIDCIEITEQDIKYMD